MDTLNPEHPPVMVAAGQRPPRIWKFWGTALWGLFIFGGMFVGQLAVIGYFVLRHGGAIDMAQAIRVPTENPGVQQRIPEVTRQRLVEMEHQRPRDPDAQQDETYANHELCRSLHLKRHRS